jgi:hypothetical protein
MKLSGAIGGPGEGVSQLALTTRESELGAPGFRCSAGSDPQARGLRRDARHQHVTPGVLRARTMTTVSRRGGGVVSDPQSDTQPQILPRVEPGFTCPACERPLAAGGSVLFQGDQLVHAICWRDGPPLTVRPPA